MKKTAPEPDETAIGFWRNRKFLSGLRGFHCFRYRCCDPGGYTIHGPEFFWALFHADPALDAQRLVNHMHLFLFSGNGVHRAVFGTYAAAFATVFTDDVGN